MNQKLIDKGNVPSEIRLAPTNFKRSTMGEKVEKIYVCNYQPKKSRKSHWSTSNFFKATVSLLTFASSARMICARPPEPLNGIPVPAGATFPRFAVRNTVPELPEAWTNEVIVPEYEEKSRGQTARRNLVTTYNTDVANDRGHALRCATSYDLYPRLPNEHSAFQNRHTASGVVDHDECCCNGRAASGRIDLRVKVATAAANSSDHVKRSEGRKLLQNVSDMIGWGRGASAKAEMNKYVVKDSSAAIQAKMLANRGG